MKVYITRAWDRDEWDYDYYVVGIFTTKEKADEAGKHYCEQQNTGKDDEGNTYQRGSYVHRVDEKELDQYFNEHLSGLAKVLK